MSVTRTCVLAALVAACGGSAAQLANDACSKGGQAYVTSGWGSATLVAARATNGTAIAKWLSRPGVPIAADEVDRWSKVSAVDLCYFDGDFSSFPGPSGVTAQYTRMLLLLPSNGDPEVLTVGPPDVVDPASGP